MARRAPSSFAAGVALATLLGLALRLAYADGATNIPGGGDDDWYHAVANLVADGHGFTSPFRAVGLALVPTNGAAPPTAFHPPLFPLVLAGVSLLGGRSYAAHQTAGCVLGALAVPVMALLVRRLAGERAGLFAAAVTAVSLPLIANESVLMSESLYTATLAGALLAAVVLRDRPSPWRALALGAAVALAALTRSEALLLLPLLALPLLWRHWRLLALAALGAALLIAPWTARNWVRFGQPVLISTNDGTVFAGANAPSTYHGPLAGFWNFAELARGPRLPANEARASDVLRRRGREYALDHAGRVPAVVGVRVLRTWGAWQPRQQVGIAVVLGGHIHRWEWAALAFYAATLALAAVALARRRDLWILATPAVLVTVTSAITFGGPRPRHALDVALAALAGIGIDRSVRALRGRRSTKGSDCEQVVYAPAR
jgi:4-amino-4-deoxy-L-arabinose transferase-like glycosyltransferase